MIASPSLTYASIVPFPTGVRLGPQAIHSPAYGHVVLPADLTNFRTAADTDPSLNYSLLPFETRSYADLITTTGQSGVGSVDIISTNGPAPVVTALHGRPEECADALSRTGGGMMPTRTAVVALAITSPLRSIVRPAAVGFRATRDAVPCVAARGSRAVAARR
jgi:hypothetical protein